MKILLLRLEMEVLRKFQRNSVESFDYLCPLTCIYCSHIDIARQYGVSSKRNGLNHSTIVVMTGFMRLFVKSMREPELCICNFAHAA